MTIERADELYKTTEPLPFRTLREMAAIYKKNYLRAKLPENKLKHLEKYRTCIHRMYIRHMTKLQMMQDAIQEDIDSCL